jgi:hypothetical protein
MREIRQSGSEGGEPREGPSLPLSFGHLKLAGYWVGLPRAS